MVALLRVGVSWCRTWRCFWHPDSGVQAGCDHTSTAIVQSNLHSLQRAHNPCAVGGTSTFSGRPSGRSKYPCVTLY